MTTPLRCSFCAKRDDEVEMLIAGPTVFICPECIDLCGDIVSDDRAKKRRTPSAAEREYASWGVT